MDAMLDTRPRLGSDTQREAIIRVRGLEVGFGERTIMKDLDLDVYRGEILGFVGASGTGKSVLTRAVLGLIPKRAGTIEVFGENVDALSPPPAKRSSAAGAGRSQSERLSPSSPGRRTGRARWRRTCTFSGGPP